MFVKNKEEALKAIRESGPEGTKALIGDAALNGLTSDPNTISVGMRFKEAISGRWLGADAMLSSKEYADVLRETHGQPCVLMCKGGTQQLGDELAGKPFGPNDISQIIPDLDWTEEGWNKLWSGGQPMAKDIIRIKKLDLQPAK